MAQIIDTSNPDEISAFLATTIVSHSYEVETPTLIATLWNEDGVPVVIFCIGYGSDADVATLRSLAESSGGQYFAGDLDTIRRLYKILSSYF